METNALVEIFVWILNWILCQHLVSAVNWTRLLYPGPKRQGEGMKSGYGFQMAWNNNFFFFLPFFFNKIYFSIIIMETGMRTSKDSEKLLMLSMYLWLLANRYYLWPVQIYGCEDVGVCFSWREQTFCWRYCG